MASWKDAPAVTHQTPTEGAAWEHAPAVGGAGAPTAAPAAHAPKPAPESPYSAKNIAGGAVEPLLTMATGMVAKPLADVAGLMLIPIHALGGTKINPATGQPYTPEEGRQKLEEALTYRPHTTGGGHAESVISYPFKKYGQFADWAGRELGSGSAYPSFGRGVAATIKELPGLLGAKGFKAGAVESKAAGVLEKADPARATAALNRVYQRLSPVPGMKAAEASRAGTMKLAEKTIADEAAKHGQVPGHYESIPHAIKPIVDRDVPGELTSDINARVQNYNEAYQTFRNKLKDEWQQVARENEANGRMFKDTAGSRLFVKKVDQMIKLYKSDRRVVAQLNDFKRMVVGDKKHTPTFDAIETAQQRIKAAAADPKNATIPNLVTAFKGISDTLNDAMGEYAPQYKEMLTKWSDIMTRKERLEKVARFSEKYAKKLRAISPTYAADARTVFKDSGEIIRSMEDDGLIDNATARRYMQTITEAEKVVTDAKVARQVSWTLIKVGMIRTAGAIGLGAAAGWWGAQILHQGARGE